MIMTLKRKINLEIGTKISKCRKLKGGFLRRRCISVSAKQGGMGDENMDVAVFRFTLGIPGFEDRLVPRVVAGVCGALLGINHLSTFPISVAQGRAELLCGALVVLLALIPEIEERLREVQPGRGRQSTATDIAGSTNAFLLDGQVTEKPKQELAWASFALLKNTNSCGSIVYSNKRTLMARGAIGSSSFTPGQPEKSLSKINEELSLVCSTSKGVEDVCSGKSEQLWLPDRASINKSGLSTCASIPQGVESLLIQHIPTSGFLMLLSERPRALSDRERSWAATIAKKLAPSL